MSLRGVYRVPIALWLGVLASAGASTVHATTVYRWTDDRGRVHYGDARTPGARAVEVKPGSGAAPVPTDPVQTARSEECERRKSQLETYRRATSVVETDALGQRREYDPQQKAKLLEIGAQQVRIACGEGATEGGS
ncbi:protein of unknown function [Hydrocarboniphaga daqingensis]|uniref:DUF4124 domain-containing protein n=2 Tax=Hydrocarboniphaga daqingensis TaxID=490188 RepID=A0A1M5LM65_9GAMM|nr:protein of unknown function [Hydrocarboniphaga daqingensis]